MRSTVVLQNGNATNGDDVDKSKVLGTHKFRKTHFSRLLSSSSLYLDSYGATLYSEQQVLEFSHLLRNSVFGNPHSQSPSSLQTTGRVEAMREAVLRFFRTDSSQHSVIFTSGATASLKLLGESFPFSPSSCLAFLRNSHNSVLGIREYVRAKGGTFTSLSLGDLHFDPDMMMTGRHTKEEEEEEESPSLLILPAECNFSGVKTPLEFVSQLRGKKKEEKEGSFLGRKRWFVGLDAAAFVSHSVLDLSEVPADFVALSFYKVFGFPTGLGALIVRNDSAGVLQKKYFGGGTVSAALPDEFWVSLRPSLSQRFEDGTSSFLDILSLGFGFQFLESFGGIEAVEAHTHLLVQRLYKGLTSLRHRLSFKRGIRREEEIEKEESSPVCKVFGLHHLNDPSKQGPALSCVFLRPNGDAVGHREFEKLAALNGISIRTGCFCNPGGCQETLGLTNKQIKENLEKGHVCWDDRDLVEGKPIGAIRISFGFYNDETDVDRFLSFVRTFFLTVEAEEISSTGTQDGIRSKEGGGEEDGGGGGEMKLVGIWVYPIKGCPGFKVGDKWEIGPRGLLYDREWSLVDSNGTAIGLKQCSNLLTLQPSIDIKSGLLRLESSSIPLLPLDISLGSYPESRMKLQVCGDECEGLLYPSHVSEWLSKATGFQCHLVRKAPISDRRAKEVISLCPLVSPSPEIAFSNESPFLLISTESLLDLKKRLREKYGPSSLVDMVTERNFRPNFVVSGGGGPYEEEKWSTIQIGDQVFGSKGSCNRCQTICVDPETGQSLPNREPLFTLSTYRRQRGRILFGCHYAHLPQISPSPHFAILQAACLPRFQDVGDT